MKKKKKKKKRKKSGQVGVYGGHWGATPTFIQREILKLKASYPSLPFHGLLLGFSSQILLHRSDPFPPPPPFQISNFHLFVWWLLSSFLAEVFNARAELADNMNTIQSSVCNLFCSLENFVDLARI
ncbi:hypothetical protein SDJN02_17269, partial [Cucurbita argyrosperma subsp. argyrosperma]